LVSRFGRHELRAGQRQKFQPEFTLHPARDVRRWLWFLPSRTAQHLTGSLYVTTWRFLIFFLPSVRFHQILAAATEIHCFQRKFMIDTNRLVQKWAGCFACILAVALITGCQSASEQASTNPASSAAAPAAPAPAAAPAQPVTPAPDATAASAAPAVAPVAVTPPVRIDCGATDKLTDSEGNVWLADEGSSDGDVFGVDDAVITNTPDSAIYQTERFGMTAYNFAVPNGKYTVKLLFAEIYSGINGPGDRVFSFSVQGHEFTDFDIWVKAGGSNTAYIQSVDVDVTNGVLNITFTPNVENPKISGIEILPRT
jgi:hypothetical protein